VRFFGIQHLLALKKYERDIDVSHIFFPYLVDFHILRRFSKPVIYTVTSGVERTCLPEHRPPCVVVVSSSEEADILKSGGIEEVHIIRPGIDLSCITTGPTTGNDDYFTIMMGSAPWTAGQFGSKGFDLMLEALNRMPDVRLICLWRGRLYREWCEKVRAAGLTDRVEIVNEKVDISGILARCHAAMVLAETPDLVKSYPNSLMEALVAGKPVMVSRAVPMSSYVTSTCCGNVVEEFSVEEITSAINEIRDNYERFMNAALRVGRQDFAVSRMVEEYRSVYQEMIE
jgi:glycosyltransferase involved in cell wall biosynthesis